jgi:Fe-S-cluster containining protein
LHLQDRKLVEEGLIHSRHLYTIRKGELANDPVRGGLIRVEGDVIKIKGRSPAWVCCFFEEDSSTCRIYEHRPLECWQLQCWDTSRLEQMYARDRLSRRDLLVKIKGLWELIAEHERRCDYDRIRGLLESMAGSGKARIQREIEQITRYDGELRKLMIARGGLEPEMLDFLLGRPLVETLPVFRRQVSSTAFASATMRRHR